MRDVLTAAPLHYELSETLAAITLRLGAQITAAQAALNLVRAQATNGMEAHHAE